MRHGKQEIITFKVDEALAKALEGIPNRSEFIRNAILAALDSVCPLCSGTGVLSVRQREHWDAFTENHTLEKCDACHEKMVVCLAGRNQETDGE